MSTQAPLTLTPQRPDQDPLTVALQAAGASWLYVDPVWHGADIAGWAVTVHRPPESNVARTSRDLTGQGETIAAAIRTALEPS